MGIVNSVLVGISWNWKTLLVFDIGFRFRTQFTPRSTNPNGRHSNWSLPAATTHGFPPESPQRRQPFRYFQKKRENEFFTIFTLPLASRPRFNLLAITAISAFYVWLTIEFFSAVSNFLLFVICIQWVTIRALAWHIHVYLSTDDQHYMNS